MMLSCYQGAFLFVSLLNFNAEKKKKAHLEFSTMHDNAMSEAVIWVSLFSKQIKKTTN